VTQHPKWRLTGSLTGRALSILGIMLLGAELVRALERGAHTRLALGEFWYLVDAGSLNGLQAGIQRYLDPGLWDMAFAPLLFAPAWTIFMVPGLILAFLTRPLQPRRIWF
jgi:hypothetical protein